MEPELGNQSRFAQAAAYVKSVRQQPEIYAIYQAAAKLSGKRACDLAHADFRHPPIIQDVDLRGYNGKIGDAIRVQAVDMLGVAAVCITLGAIGWAAPRALLTRTRSLSLANGSTLPKRTLPQSRPSPFHATATDRAGNSVTKTLHHAILPLDQPPC